MGFLNLMSDVMNVAVKLLDWIEAAARRRDPRLISLLSRWATLGLTRRHLTSQRQLAVALQIFVSFLTRPKCDGAHIHLDLELARRIGSKTTACRCARRASMRARDAEPGDE